jgi:H+/Cl- antiporter ClcA
MSIGVLVAACVPAFAQTQTPEPGTVVLLGVALVGGGAYAAWKNKKK